MEFANQAQHVRIDVVGPPRIEQQTATSWRFPHRRFQRCFVEKANLIAQLNVQQVTVNVLFMDLSHRTS